MRFLWGLCQAFFFKFLYAQDWAIPEWANIVTFHPKHPKGDQNLLFTPQSETMSIPVTLMWSSPSNHTLWHFDRTLRNKSQQWIITFFKCFVTSFNKMLITQKFRFKEVLLPFLLVHSSYFSSERKQRNSANSFYILQTSCLPNEEIDSETWEMLIRLLFQRLKFSESQIKKTRQASI